MKTNSIPKVLIVDDEFGVRESLSLLMKGDFDVFTADTMTKGITLFSDQRPDAVILDIRLPDMSGIEGLREIRKLDENATIIMLTAYGTMDMVKRAIRLGANDYVDKPFKPQEMLQIVRKSIARARSKKSSERAVEELKALNESLVDEISHKAFLANLGLASVEYAHDISNPLTGVIGYVDILAKEIADAEDVLGERFENIDKYVTAIRNNVQRCCQLSKRWIAVARKGSAQIQTFSISQLLSDIVNEKWLENAKSPSAPKIRLIPCSDPCVIVGDKLQIYRAINNIVINSIQALDQCQGEIIIVNRSDKDAVEVRISDNGAGIAKDKLEKIFNPFFSTKRSDDSTCSGLGLYITNKIVTDHQGTIDFDSEVGRGTSVTIRLPKNPV